MQKPVLSLSFKQELAAHNPIGITTTPDDVQAWFDLIWPRYMVRGYRNHRRAVASWWSRIREQDILDARARVARMQEEASVALLDQWAESQPRPTPRRDFAAQLMARSH